MADEEKVAEETIEESSPTEEPEDTSEQQASEEVPEEPEDNKERSQLGRRVKAMEESQERFFNEMRNLIQERKPSQPPEDEFEDDWIPTTKDELEKWADARDRKKEEKRQLYEDSYRAQLNTFSKEENFEQIVNEMMTNHNIKYSDDGVSDARVNYLNAKVAYLESKAKEKKSPLKKNEGKRAENLGGAIESENMGKEGPGPIKLDPEAAKVAKDLGLTDEQIQKALSEDMSPELVAGKVSFP